MYDQSLEIYWSSPCSSSRGPYYILVQVSNSTGLSGYYWWVTCLASRARSHPHTHRPTTHTHTYALYTRTHARTRPRGAFLFVSATALSSCWTASWLIKQLPGIKDIM